jgi:hypothetical protein
MGDSPIGRAVSSGATVQEDWQAWLPEEKSSLFEAVYDELEVSYVILSVALDDAFTFCEQGKLLPAREQAGVFSDLFDRLSGRLRGVLRSLNEHGRHFGSHSRVTPLRAELFRSDRAQMMVRANHVLSLVSLRKPSRFFRKLAALDELVTKLQKQTREISAEIVEGASVYLPRQWTHLEVLHHDLNTCFCETTVVLKSFLRALPAAELLPFRKRLLSLVPKTLAVRPRRPAPFATRIASACEPQPAVCPSQGAAANHADNPRSQRQ